jgi:CelD/BcsL family acetyltransferase involved in cellulose biosynthesis
MNRQSQEGLPRVESFRQFDALRPHLPAIEELNRNARRPSPFSRPQYLAAYLAHDEAKDPAADPLLLLAFDDQQPIGFLPLKTRPVKVFGVPQKRVELLTTHDTDRPGLVARAGDEPRCVDAFLRHLTTVEKDWSFLELIEQDDSSPLFTPQVDPEKFYLRHYPNNPNSTVTLEGDFPSWYRGLSKNLKQNVSRSARSLAAQGTLEMVTCDRPEAAPALLDLYLELETRSWKSAALAGVARHPERIELFRSVLSQGGDMRPLFFFLVVDGVTVAGLIALEFAGTAYEWELAFDSGWSAFSPGNVIFTLAVRGLFARGTQAFNLLGNYAYYKSRWAAKVTPTHAVQVYRRGTVSQLKARAGELRRRLFGEKRFQQNADFNLAKPKEAAERAPLRPHSRALLQSTLEELSQKGLPFERLSGAALEAVFPFSLKGGRHG